MSSLNFMLLGADIVKKWLQNMQNSLNKFMEKTKKLSQQKLMQQFIKLQLLKMEYKDSHLSNFSLKEIQSIMKELEKKIIFMNGYKKKQVLLLQKLKLKQIQKNIKKKIYQFYIIFQKMIKTVQIVIKHLQLVMMIFLSFILIIQIMLQNQKSKTNILFMFLEILMKVQNLYLVINMLKLKQ